MSTRMKFGAFLAPHHPIGEHPTLQLRRDLELAEQLDDLLARRGEAARGAAERLGERHDSRIGRAAGDIGRVHLLARGADDVDDHAALFRLHARIHRAREIDVAEELQVPGFAPGGLVNL